MRNDLRALIVCIGLIAGMLAVPGGVHAKSYGLGSPEQEIAEQIEIINSEITSETPNRLAIQQALLVIRTRGNQDFEPALHELRSMLKQKRLSISKIERRGELYNEFDKAIAAVRNRIEVRSAADVKKDEASPTAQSRPTYFRDYLLKAKDDPRAKQGHQIHEKIPTIPEEYLLVVLSGILTDDIRLGRATGKPQVLSGRDIEAQKVMDVLVRSKARNPVLVGSAGVGKTSVARIVAEDILDGHYPHTDVYLSELENAEIIVTTPSRMSQMALSNEPTAQAAAVEQFFDAVRAVEQNYLNKTGVKKNLIVFIDDMHALDPPQINALKQVIENEQHPVRIIGASLNEALELKLKKASGIKKLLEIIPVQEFSVEQTLNLLKGTWAPEFLEKYNVKFTEKALSVLLTVSAYIRPGLARPEGPFMVMQEVAVKAHRDQEGQLVEIDDDYIYEYVRKVTGIPTNPHNADEFDGYLKNLSSTLSARVANQQNMIDALVDVWSQVLTGNPQIPKSVLLTGPTGTGKTLLAENFAREAFGDTGRMFKIDGTLLQDGKFALGSIFGVPTGVQGADITAGSFMEWLDDPAHGKMGGVIVINEAEKMHPDAWRRLMEFKSEGIVYGGDGKPRYANRHVLILTTNKGTREIFPDAVKNWSQAEIDTRIAQLSETDIKSYFLRSEPGREEFVLPREIMGRISRAVVANPVTEETAVIIGEIEVQQYVAKIMDIYHIKINVDQRLIQHLSITGLDSLEGARPIHNQVETYINEAMTEARKRWSIARDEALDLKLVEFAPGVRPEIEVSFKGESFNIKAPKNIVNNPLADQETREMLDRLSDVMHGHMVEQPESVNAVTQAIRAKNGDAGRRRPISITVVGTTGVGKTEIGRAIALARYGSLDRANVIGLGEAHSNAALDIIFGIGQKSVSEFEQILMNNPQGGVITFDEFSNMGGDKEAVKTAMIKRFYTMLEEGVWRSPRPDGPEYDLNKYIFLFTGNDLEEELQGVSGDEQRLAIWEKIKHREKVQALLLKKGVPEAFLGRQDVVAVLRPLVGAAQPRVTGKLIEEWQARFQKQHHGVVVEWEPEFLQQLAASFFSHDRGARSVRSVIENQISSLSTELLLKNNYDTEANYGLKIKLSMTDNLSKTSFTEGEIQNRKVAIYATLLSGDTILQKLEVDATDAATKIVVLSKEEALLTAYREAGRLVLNNAELTQEIPVYVTIHGSMVNDERVLGYSRYEPVIGANQALTKRKVLALLKSLWAGRLAQEKAGFEADFMWEKSISKMRKLASDFLVKSGLGDGLEVVRVNDDGEPQLSSEQRESLDSEMKKLFVESKKMATDEIEANWPQVEQYVRLLLEKGELGAGDLKTSAVNKSSIQSNAQSSACAELLSTGQKSN